MVYIMKKEGGERERVRGYYYDYKTSAID